MKAGTFSSGEEFVESVGVPPAVHVGFAEAEATFGEDSIEKLGVVEMQIPRIGAVHLDAGHFEELYDLTSRLRLSWPELAAPVV